MPKTRKRSTYMKKYMRLRRQGDNPATIQTQAGDEALRAEHDALLTDLLSTLPATAPGVRGLADSYLRTDRRLWALLKNPSVKTVKAEVKVLLALGDALQTTPRTADAAGKGETDILSLLLPPQDAIRPHVEWLPKDFPSDLLPEVETITTETGWGPSRSLAGLYVLLGALGMTGIQLSVGDALLVTPRSRRLAAKPQDIQAEIDTHRASLAAYQARKPLNDAEEFLVFVGKAEDGSDLPVPPEELLLAAFRLLEGRPGAVEIVRKRWQEAGLTWPSCLPEPAPPEQPALLDVTPPLTS